MAVVRLVPKTIVSAALDLKTLAATTKISTAITNYYVEAAEVMLARYHPAPPPPTAIQVSDEGRASKVTLGWEKPSDDVCQSHGNIKDATEDGACAVAMALAHHLGFVVVKRAHQGSGADLLMVRKGDPENDFYRLEVSGIAERGSPGGRIREKLSELEAGDLDRPGVAVVVRFKELDVKIARWQR